MERRKHRKHRFMKVLAFYFDGDRNVEIDRKCGKLGQTVAVG